MAIVCVCVRTAKIALVTRSAPPDKSIWALPGGKVEVGEPTIDAAIRELHEECGLNSDSVQWHEAPFTVTDVIRPAVGEPDAGTKFHYLLAQTFCKTAPHVDPAQLVAGDDAGDAGWYSLQEIEGMQASGVCADGVEAVVKRGLLLHEHGLLPLTK